MTEKKGKQYISTPEYPFSGELKEGDSLTVFGAIESGGGTGEKKCCDICRCKADPRDNIKCHDEKCPYHTEKQDGEHSEIEKALIALNRIVATNQITPEIVETADFMLKNYEEEKKEQYVRYLLKQIEELQILRVKDRQAARQAGYEEEAIKCHQHCEAARQAALEEVEAHLEKSMNAWEDIMDFGSPNEITKAQIFGFRQAYQIIHGKIVDGNMSCRTTIKQKHHD